MYELTPAITALFPGRSRRALLASLFQDGLGAASSSELARRARLTPRALAVEVRRLEAAGLVTVEAVGAAHLVRPNLAHPAAGALRALLGATAAPEPAPAPGRGVRESLAAHGARLRGTSATPGYAPMPLPEALLHGLRVSYADAEVLLALPGVLARHARDLDWTDLRERARRMKLKAELGLLLELTAEVAGMPALAGEAGGLRDRRRSVPRCLPEERSGHERRLADERTPEVARRWGFRMNLTLEAFRSAFDGGAAPGTGREAAVARTGQLELLRAIDAELPGPARVAVVGESALALCAGSIDDVPTLEIAAIDFRDFWEAAERAGTRRGTGPALRPARDLRAPFAWRDRLSPADLPGLTRLHVLLPERHDLALLLAGGGLASGLQLAEELHRRQPLRPGVLLARHHEADDGRIENDGAFVRGFLALAHRLFGAELAGRLEAHLAGGAPAPDVG